MPPVENPPFDAPAARLRSTTAVESSLDIPGSEKDHARRQLDGIGGGRGGEMPKDEVAKVSGEAAVEAKDDDASDEDDLDPETARNTMANEKVRHSRSSPKSSPGRSPAKRVGFVDEARNARVLDGHKSSLHNPRASEKTKAHAKELLSFHGELGD